MKTSECRYRILDVAILDADAPRNSVALVPLLAAFEILSPEDRLSKLMVRLADFETMGIPALYIIDPADNSFFRHQGGKLSAVEQVEVPGHRIASQEIIDLLW